MRVPKDRAIDELTEELTGEVRRTPCRLSGRGQADFQWREPLFFRLGCGPPVLTTGSLVWGRSPEDRIHRPFHCRQHGAAGTPPSRRAQQFRSVLPVLSVPPIRLPRRSRAPAGLPPTRSVSCPYCVAQWVSAGFVYGLVFAPRATRLIAGTCAAYAAYTVADFLGLAYEEATKIALSPPWEQRQQEQG